MLTRLRNRIQNVDLKHAQTQGQVRLWSLSVDSLEAIEQALSNAPEFLAGVADPAERIVHTRLERATRPPIPDYDELNVRKVGDAVRELGRVDLEKVRRYEAANKNRKTVFDAIDKQLERLEPDDVAA